MSKLTFITGSLVEELVMGSKIIHTRFDGWDWHVLVERPKPTSNQDPNADKQADNKYWKYGVYKTSVFTLPDYEKNNEFGLMSEHNRTPKDMLNKFNEEFYECKFTNERIEERRKIEKTNA